MTNQWNLLLNFKKTKVVTLYLQYFEEKIKENTKHVCPIDQINKNVCLQTYDLHFEICNKKKPAC